LLYYKNKIGVLVSTLYRLQRNSSNYVILRHAVFKLYFELTILCYPFNRLKKAIYHVYTRSKDKLWFYIYHDYIKYRYKIKQLQNIIQQPRSVAHTAHDVQLYDLCVDPG